MLIGGIKSPRGSINTGVNIISTQVENLLPTSIPKRDESGPRMIDITNPKAAESSTIFIKRIAELFARGISRATPFID
jgi:hypothetical protein